MDCGESSDDVDGSEASFKKWKYETDNGKAYNCGVNRCSVFSIPAYVTFKKLCEVGNSVFGLSTSLQRHTIRHCVSVCQLVK